MGLCLFNHKLHDVNGIAFNFLKVNFDLNEMNNFQFVAIY